MIGITVVHRVALPAVGLLVVFFGVCGDLRAAEGEKVLQPVYELLIGRSDSGNPDGQDSRSGDPVVRPSFADAGGLPELSGEWYGAMGEYQVRRNTLPSPWPDYADNVEMNVDIFFPAGRPGRLPTVFFISGYGQYSSDRYRSLLYFIASQGYNCVFIPHLFTQPDSNPQLLLTIIDGVVARFSEVIDTGRVGFVGHSEGGGLIYYLARERAQWGGNGRFLFSLAAWWGFHLPPTGNVDYPAGTNLIVQIAENDSGTDPRQNIDFLLHNNIPAARKTLLYIPGDADHAADHWISYSREENGVYYYDALQQVAILRPLESLMRYSFENDDQWKMIGLPDPGDANYDTMTEINGIAMLFTDDPLGNTLVPIPAEADLVAEWLCSHSGNPRRLMCMPCRDTSRTAEWRQCAE